MGRIRAVALLVALAAAPVAAQPLTTRATSGGVEQVAEVPYANGMHLLVTRSGGRDFAIASAAAGSDGALRFFDVTDPSRPKLTASLPCTGNQGFMQLSHDGETLIVGEGVRRGADPCMPAQELGFYTIDISDPQHPKPLGYADVERGGHTLTAHPRRPVVYVSYGDPVGTSGPAEFEVWSIRNPAKPKHLATVAVTGHHGPHDIAFNRDGTRAVAASMSLIQVLDTTSPARPEEIEVLQCPGCTHNHEAHFTPDQEHVVVSDETSGGAASPCPLGGLYFYEWNAQAAPHMTLIGEWQPGEVGTASGAPTNAGLCTSHVFDISRDGTKIAASWHNGGVRVVDITDMAGVGVGDQGDGAKEIGWAVEASSDAWSAKFDRTGRYVFVNDRLRGFQVYRITKT